MHHTVGDQISRRDSGLLGHHLNYAPSAGLKILDVTRGRDASVFLVMFTVNHAGQQQKLDDGSLRECPQPAGWDSCFYSTTNPPSLNLLLHPEPNLPKEPK